MTDVLRESGLNNSADRLSYLQQLADDDPDEVPMAIGSLRQLAAFLMDERQFGEPEIGVNPEGLALAQWRVAGNGILAMEFLSSGLIRFAGTSGPGSQNGESLRVSGTLPKTKALEAVQPFLS